MMQNFNVELSVLDAHRCFVEKSSEPVLVLDVIPEESTNSCKVSQSACWGMADLESHCAKESKSKYLMRIYSISQRRSYAPLAVTEPMFKFLVEQHEVMSDISDFVDCFRKQIDHIEAGYCEPFHRKLCAKKLELAYAFKFPEWNGRINGDPWSMRQMAVYYQYNRINDQHTWILLNVKPESTAWKKLESEFLDGILAETCRVKQNNVHSFLFSTYFGNWKPFLSYYEGKAADIFRMVLGTRLSHMNAAYHDTLDQIRYLEDKCLPLTAILSSYCRIMFELRKLADHNFVESSPERESSREDLRIWTQNGELRARALQDNAEVLKAQRAQAAQLLRDRIDFKQSEDVLIMARSSFDNSETVRVITIITLVYLSFTVVASVMDLQFFHSEPDSWRLEVSPAIWVFFAISIPLTIFTVGAWKLKMWLKTRSRDTDEAAKGYSPV